MELILIGIIKIIDNLLNTSRALLVQKGEAFYSSIMVVISQIIFFNIISKVVQAKDNTTAIVVSICAGIGTYIAMYFNDKYSKDKLFLNIVTCDDIEAMWELRDYLFENKIKSIIYDSYTREGGKTLAMNIFAETKHESILLEEYIKEHPTTYLMRTK